MKLLKTIMATSLLAAAGFSGVASAHDYLGTLGNAAAATDRWYFTCAAGAASMTYRIKRTAGTPCVQLSFDTTGVATVSCGVWSPTKTVATGAGAKIFTIKKNPAIAGTDSYDAQIHCIDANGVHNPDDQSAVQTYIQNQ
jgi:hypothetical protein